MNLKKITCCCVFLLSALWAHASELSDKLQSSDYVLLMRHTLAPGVGDPAGYTLEDCKTQRNLSAEGRQHAGVVGDWLRKQGVTSADVYSSAWCRCKDTAELLKFNSFQVAPPLASFFDEMHLAKSRTQALEQFIAEKLKTKGHKALILVTHHVNIHAFMGENIASGDMVLARVDARGKMRSYQLIPRPSQAQL
jgi:phosphohistidine phosphatase SixA